MPEIKAAAVKELRQRTGLPMMDCKRALQEVDGDGDAAIELLRKQGATTQDSRAGRETAFGRMGIYASLGPGVGAMVELKCESSPVAGSDDFIRLADDLAQQLATGPGAATADELMAQPSPSQQGVTLREQKDELYNRMREVFNVGRLIRIDAPCGAYSHNAGTISGVLCEVTGGNPQAAKDVCMHIAAMRPGAVSKEELPQDEVDKEREILAEAARQEGKPEKIIEKMVEGRLRNYYAERVLKEQPFVKEDKMTVGQFAENNGMQIIRFAHWELGGD